MRSDPIRVMVCRVVMGWGASPGLWKNRGVGERGKQNRMRRNLSVIRQTPTRVVSLMREHQTGSVNPANQVPGEGEQIELDWLPDTDAAQRSYVNKDIGLEGR